MCHSDYVHGDSDNNLYSAGVLNGLKPSNFPIHKLVLKVNVPVMLLMNIDQKCGLWNGTRLRLIALGNRVIEAEVISGNNIGNHTFISRMSLTPLNKRISFTLKKKTISTRCIFCDDNK